MPRLPASVATTDESIRRSSFRALTDPALFELCEPFVRRASAEDPTLDYMLLRNDATHIVYRVRQNPGRNPTPKPLRASLQP